jgi:DNA mismatch repair protein MSH5
MRKYLLLFRISVESSTGQNLSPVILSAFQTSNDPLHSLLALAHGASQHSLTRPRMTDENIISIKAGRSVLLGSPKQYHTLTKPRHLLQEMTVPTYITNDAFLVGGKGDQQRERSQTIEREESTSRSSSDIDGPSMIVLTGPNYSGKSVYQKQIAVAVYMAHIGSFVPADAAVIGLTDKILTRITTRESVSKTQSAFMIDVQQIALALNQATRRSLVVIDEFGKGTDSCGQSDPRCAPGQAQELVHCLSLSDWQSWN